MKDIVKLLEHQITESDVNQSIVGDQIARNYRYYSLQPLGNEVKGRSHYNSPDVLDSVESKKALLKETFLSARQTVKFASEGLQVPFEADGKTAYVNKTLKKNKNERLFSDFWHDAFLAKRGVFFAQWKEDSIPVEMPVQNMTEQQVYQMASAQGNVVDVDMSQLEMVQVPTVHGPVITFSGLMTVYVDDSGVDIQKPAPERYYRDPQVTDVEDAMWAGFHDDVPRGTLKLQGYDEDQIDKLSVEYRWRENTVDFARNAHSESGQRMRQYSRAEDQETVTVYKTWTWVDLEEYGHEPGIKLYEIHWAAGEVLKWADGSEAVREAQEMPFFEWSELRIPDSAYGMCDADVVSHTQKTQSTLKRLIIDNQQQRNTPRYEAVQDRLLNPRDLLDTAIGGVVWSDAIGSVAPLNAPELSPLTMGVIGLLQQDNERRSGMSSLAKGMNTDVLKYQNADSMIERLTNAGTTRPMAAARDWAQTCLIPLCQYIVKLAMRHDKTQTQVEMGGRVIPVIPSQWQDDECAMDVAVALTPDEGTNHAQQLLMLHQLMSQDPELMKLYGVNQRHALMDQVFDAIGVSDTTRYLMRPESPEYQQRQQQEAQMAQQAMQEQKQKEQAQIQMIIDEQSRKWAETNNKLMDTIADNERDDEALEWQKFVDTKEIAIEEGQQRQAEIG